MALFPASTGSGADMIRFDGVRRVEYGVHMAIMYIPFAETNSWFHRKSKSAFRVSLNISGAWDSSRSHAPGTRLRGRRDAKTSLGGLIHARR
jgi:hypothetical protein